MATTSHSYYTTKLTHSMCTDDWLTRARNKLLSIIFTSWQSHAIPRNLTQSRAIPRDPTRSKNTTTRKNYSCKKNSHSYQDHQDHQVNNTNNPHRCKISHPANKSTNKKTETLSNYPSIQQDRTTNIRQSQKASKHKWQTRGQAWAWPVVDTLKNQTVLVLMKTKLCFKILLQSASKFWFKVLQSSGSTL